MSDQVTKEIELEIAHILFTDTVGYSKLSINEQRAVVDELNEIVRSSDQYQKAEAAGRFALVERWTAEPTYTLPGLAVGRCRDRISSEQQ